MSVTHSDCIIYLRTLPDASVDSCVTDPPYELGFMGKKWDNSGIAYSVEMWREVLRVLKPGGHLLAFGGTRTHHRMVCAIEDAGFEIRDEMQWLYGSGFPKSLDISKKLDQMAGAERERGAARGKIGMNKTRVEQGYRKNEVAQSYESGPAVTVEAQQWDGWGTALKPACEPICVARKPLEGTVATNVLKHGTGGINVDGGRIGTNDKLGGGAEKETTADQKGNKGWTRPWMEDKDARDDHASRVRENVAKAEQLGRWPANVMLTHANGCVCAGTKRVKGITGGTGNHDGSVYGARSKQGESVKDYADADGMETVEAWQCVDGCPVKLLDEQSGELTSGAAGIKNKSAAGSQGHALGKESRPAGTSWVAHTDTGGASRFFYTAKASRSEREAFNTHATVKPLALMRYLVRLVTPPGGIVLDMFAGSGTTLVAARQESFRFLGCDADEKHVQIARDRLGLELAFEPISSP